MRFSALVQRAAQMARRGRGSQEQAPPALLEPVRFPYGPFRFRVKTARRSTYTILASTDFSNWQPLMTEEASADVMEYVDSEAPKFSYRFYCATARGIPSPVILGYVAITLPPRFSLIANPFQRGNNVVAEAFKNWPDGTTLNKFDTLLLRLSENAV